MNRRTFVGAAASAGAVALINEPFALAGRRLIGARDGRFRQGVASGQPTDRAITLWTRIEDLGGDSSLKLEVAREKDFRRVVAREEVVAKESRDFTVHARLGGLEPGERYFYRFYTPDRSSPVGRFRTAVPPDSREKVKIGFFSCQDYESGFYTAHAGLAEQDDLELIVCLGDYIYERSFDDQKVREDRTGANRDGEVQTLREYRDKYNFYHSDENLKALRASHAMVEIWDDHEVEDNYADDEPGEATQDQRVSFRKRRRNGYQAFFEHMPRIRKMSDRDRIYGKLQLGRNAELFLLDSRQYRDDQPCDDQIGAPCPPSERNDPSRTLLGGDQTQWLKRGLERSDATWKVVGNQVMIMALDAPAGNPLNPDQWDGYGAERREILEHVRDRGIEDVTFITGDIHTFFAGNVTPAGREQVVGGEQSVATEFVGGSMTSKGIADSLPAGEDVAAIVGDDGVVKTNNPHIKFSNQAEKGYGILEAEKDELRVRYRFPETVEQRTSDVSTLARFRVESGSAEVEIV